MLAGLTLAASWGAAWLAVLVPAWRIPLAALAAAVPALGLGLLIGRRPDDSELRHLDTALRDQEARLRVLSDNLPGCMVYQIVREPDNRQRFLYVSRGVEALHGLPAAAVLADAGAIMEQILPEDRPGRAAALAAAARTDGDFHFSLRIRRADGAIRTMSVWSRPRRTAAGERIWDGLEMDVTEQVRLGAERERLARAIEAHHDGAYWLDIHNRIVYVNEAACRMSGYTRAELIGSPVTLLSPGASPERLAEVWQALRRDGSYSTQGSHRRKDGVVLPVEIACTYVQVGGEEFNCGFAHDITSRVRAENELQSQLSELKRWQKLTLDREARVLELKAEINRLREARGQPARYASVRP